MYSGMNIDIRTVPIFFETYIIASPQVSPKRGTSIFWILYDSCLKILHQYADNQPRKGASLQHFCGLQPGIRSKGITPSSVKVIPTLDVSLPNAWVNWSLIRMLDTQSRLSIEVLINVLPTHIHPTTLCFWRLIDTHEPELRFLHFSFKPHTLAAVGFCIEWYF
jgi:hypothetical protein